MCVILTYFSSIKIISIVVYGIDKSRQDMTENAEN